MRIVSTAAGLAVLAVLPAALALTACESESTPGTTHPDASNPGDADPSADATVPDSGIAEPPDSGTPDTGPPGHEPDSPIDDRFRAVADAFEAERISFAAPGAALLILEHGEITFARGFGNKHPAGAAADPVHATTLFRIGSVNKMLTSAVLLQHVAEGTVSLDAAVTDVIPGFTFFGDAAGASMITIRNILSHSSGIVDYLEVNTTPADQQDSALNAFLTGPFRDIGYLMDPPGRMYNYSNPNYYLAGLAIEKVGGISYRQAMHDRLFAPLAMERTYFLGSEVMTDGDYADGLTLDRTGNAEIITPLSYENAWGRPAGFAFSSVRDLAKFALFLSRGNEEVLADAQRMAMQSPQVSTKELLDFISYGFGLTIYDGVFLGQNYYPIRVISHDGAIPGYSADLWYFPALDFGFITLASADGAYFANTLFTALTTLPVLPAPATPPDLELDRSTFGKYAGNYQDDHNAGRIQITVTGTVVNIRMPDVEAAHIPYGNELHPIAPDNFLLDVQGTQLQVTFILDDQGNPEYFRTRPFVAHKVMSLWSAASPRPRPSPISVDRERLIRSIERAAQDRRRTRLVFPN